VLIGRWGGSCFVHDEQDGPIAHRIPCQAIRLPETDSEVRGEGSGFRVEGIGLRVEG